MPKKKYQTDFENLINVYQFMNSEMNNENESFHE